MVVGVLDGNSQAGRAVKQFVGCDDPAALLQPGYVLGDPDRVDLGATGGPGQSR